eukprot:TRINITY_DN63130_c0_g1_i1.p1 TRINITY_DN63130_c0_g1~~TRINITY_DN63130_c0_g1_i1.p1  ORF type:complete len:503 (+),score=53.51 TRINITY_DN63130_c0_g1_i1:45-1553(+)
MDSLQRIAIVSIGLRGTLEQTVALAVVLRDAGYDTLILTSVTWQSFVQEAGLQVAAVFGDIRDPLTDASASKALTEQGMTAFIGITNKALAKHHARTLPRLLKAVSDFKPDLILQCGIYAAYATLLLEYRKTIPCLRIYWRFIPENPETMVFGMKNLPFGMNKYSVRSLLGSLHDFWVENLDPITQSVAGFKVCDTYTKDMYFEDLFNPPMPTIVAEPEAFGKVLSPDAPANVVFIGPLSLSRHEQIAQSLASSAGRATSGPYGDYSILMKVSKFIESGTKPIYMGWGSWAVESPEQTVETISRALMLGGFRAIIQAGWTELTLDCLERATVDEALLEYAERNVLFVPAVPHQWLFPQCACIVHHGGVGTLMSAVRACVPNLITPIAWEHFDSAHLVNELFLGFGFDKHFVEVTAQELANALTACVADDDVLEMVKEVGEEVRSCEGELRIVDAVQTFWEEQVKTGKLQSCVKKRLSRGTKPKNTYSCCTAPSSDSDTGSDC